MSNIKHEIVSLLQRAAGLRHEMAWIIFGQFLGFVGGFIGIKVLTGMMGPTGYGELAIGLTIAGILTIYVYGPLSNVVARYYTVYNERQKLGVYFPVLKKIHRFLALLLCLLSVISALIASIWFGRQWGIIILLSLCYGIASGVNASFISLQSAIRQRWIVAVHQGLDVWLRIGLSIALLFFLTADSSYALFGYLIGTLAVTISQYFFARRSPVIADSWSAPQPDRAEEKQCRREFTAYALPFFVFALFATISMYADRWVLQAVSGAASVGIYAAIYQIASSPVNLFFSMVNQLVIPIVFERAGSLKTATQAEKSAELVKITIIGSTIVMLSATGLAWYFGEPLVRLLTNSVFAAEHRVLWITLTGLALFNIAQLVALKGIYGNRPGIYFWPKFLQAAALVGFGLLLTNSYGLTGMAAALCCSSLLYLASVIFVNRRIHFSFADDSTEQHACHQKDR